MAEELTFHLEDFDGPLELLLALVAKHKMDLHNIPILQLIDQYTRTVEQADPDPETASAFIEMAAHLVEMKSFLLLPRSEEGERMKQELTGQLIEYDQCRRMAALLRQKAEAAPVFVQYVVFLDFQLANSSFSFSSSEQEESKPTENIAANSKVAEKKRLCKRILNSFLFCIILFYCKFSLILLRRASSTVKL